MSSEKRVKNQHLKQDPNAIAVPQWLLQSQDVNQNVLAPSEGEAVKFDTQKFIQWAQAQDWCQKCVANAENSPVITTKSGQTITYVPQKGLELSEVNQETLQAAMESAKEMGWKGVDIGGVPEEQRALAWKEARKAGFEEDQIKGYEPTAEDKEQLNSGQNYVSSSVMQAP